VKGLFQKRRVMIMVIDFIKKSGIRFRRSDYKCVLTDRAVVGLDRKGLLK